jgi:hypothetical protein
MMGMDGSGVWLVARLVTVPSYNNKKNQADQTRPDKTSHHPSDVQYFYLSPEVLNGCPSSMRLIV